MCLYTTYKTLITSSFCSYWCHKSSNYYLLFLCRLDNYFVRYINCIGLLNKDATAISAILKVALMILFRSPFIQLDEEWRPKGWDFRALVKLGSFTREEFIVVVKSTRAIVVDAQLINEPIWKWITQGLRCSYVTRSLVKTSERKILLFWCSFNKIRIAFLLLCCGLHPDKSVEEKFNFLCKHNQF